MRKLLTLAGIAALTSTTALAAMPSMNTYGYTDLDALPKSGAVRVSGMVQQRYDADTFDLTDAEGDDIDVHTPTANYFAPGTFVTVDGTVSSDVAGAGNEIHATRVRAFDARQASWSNYIPPTAYNIMPSVPGSTEIRYPDLPGEERATYYYAPGYESAEVNTSGRSSLERYENRSAAGMNAQAREDYNPDISQEKAQNEFDPRRVNDGIDVSTKMKNEPMLHNYDLDENTTPNDPAELTAAAQADYVREDRYYDANRAMRNPAGGNNAALSDFNMLSDNRNATVTGEVAAIVDGDTFILRDAKGETIDVHTASTAGLRVGEVVTLNGNVRSDFMGFGQEIRTDSYSRYNG